MPYPPGGGVDAMARIVADKLSVALGQQVVVDNRGGGSGLVGTRAVIKAAPDGYTLFLGHTGSISINPSLYANAGFDPRKDFTAIGLIASMPVALIAHPSFPAKTIGEVGRAAEGQSRQIQYRHLGGRHRRLHVGRAVQVGDRHRCADRSLQGHGGVMNDLLGGHVPVAFGVLPPALGNIQSGTLRAIAVFERPALQPACRTCRPSTESGLPGFESVLHYGVLGAGRHAASDRRQDQCRTAQARRHRRGEAAHPVRRRRSADLEPEEYAADIDQEETKWSALIRKLSLKVE